MNTVTVNMKDAFTGKAVTREIDITSIMNCRNDGFFLGTELEQKENLECWIEERANEQHETFLDLVSWEIH